MEFWNKRVDLSGGLRIALVALMIFVGMSFYLNIRNKELTQTLSNSYDKAFYELVEYTENVETLLAKAQISNTSSYSAKTLNNIWRKADLAQSSLSQIPTDSNVLNTAVKFFNQLSDYSYSLANKLIDGENLKDDDYEKILPFWHYGAKKLAAATDSDWKEYFINVKDRIEKRNKRLKKKNIL